MVRFNVWTQLCVASCPCSSSTACCIATHLFYLHHTWLIHCLTPCERLHSYRVALVKIILVWMKRKTDKKEQRKDLYQVLTKPVNVSFAGGPEALSESPQCNDMVADLHFPRFFGTAIKCEIARRFPRSVVKVGLHVQCKNISISSGVQPWTSTDLKSSYFDT